MFLFVIWVEKEQGCDSRRGSGYVSADEMLHRPESEEPVTAGEVSGCKDAAGFETESDPVQAARHA